MLRRTGEDDRARDPPRLDLRARRLSALAAVAVHDLLQRDHALLRNFPVLGHARYLLEAIGPELRQYIVAGNNEERPFTRDQRRWVYASAKKREQLLRLRHRQRHRVHRRLPGHQAPHVRAGGAAVRADGRRTTSSCRARRCSARARGRRGARSGRESVVNISAMSFGSLSGNAIEALNRGAALAGCLHNTGEGGLSPYHRNGGELIFQIGTAYFGCRDERRPVQPRPAQGPRRRRAGPGTGDQAQPGREARPRRAAARRRRSPPRSPRCAASREGAGLHQPVPARRVLRHRQPAGLGRAARRRDRAAGRHQVGRRRPATSGTS